MFQNVDLIWTGLVTLGGFMLLIDHDKDLNKFNRGGVGLIFVGFLFQVYWKFIAEKDWSRVVQMSVIFIFGILVWQVYGLLSRKRKSSKAVKN